MAKRSAIWLGMIIAAGSSLCASQQVQAGVIAESTRLIYLEGQRERSLMLANTNPYPVVVQTWVNNGEDEPAPETAVTPMIVVPSVFRLQPGALQGVRVIFNGNPLPKDRESVFWLNIYEIAPTASRTPTQTSKVGLAMNTQMKIFYRPKSLPPQPQDFSSALSFRLKKESEVWHLVVHNPTPYHASFSSLRLVSQGKEMPVTQALDMMTNPFSSRSYDIPATAALDVPEIRVRFTLVDDGGHYQDGSSILLRP